MSEKATIFQTVQTGIETTPGTAVAANKKLLATSIEVQPQTAADNFRAAGNKYASFVTMNKEWTNLALSGKLTYNEILYLLASLLSLPTPTHLGTGAAYKWTYISDTDGPDAGKTLTIEQGDANTAWRIAGAQVSGLTFTFNRNEVSISGAGIGQAIATGITMTASPTALNPLPVLPGHVKFYMADSQTGLDAATALSRGFSLTWGLSDKIGLVWPVGQPPITVETEPKTESKLRLATDTVGMGVISTMRSGATKWFRIQAIGALIEDTYSNTFQLDFPAQVSELGGFDSEDGIHVGEFGLTPIHDATWGKMFQIDVTNAVQAL